MPSLREYQSQFKAALDRAPSYLVLDGFYIYKVDSTAYDPVTDTYGTTDTANIVIKCLRGLELVEGVNRITFLTESLPFTFGKPSVNGVLLVNGEEWNIRSIRQDPIGLTYTFVVESKDGI